MESLVRDTTKEVHMSDDWQGSGAWRKASAATDFGQDDLHQQDGREEDKEWHCIV